jgi:hypothetical protein
MVVHFTTEWSRGARSPEPIDDVMDDVTEENMDEMTLEEAHGATGTDG